MSTDPAPSILRRLWLRALATVGLVAAVLLSWWWKVEDARPSDQILSAAFGTPIDLGRTLLTPLALEWHPSTGELVLNAVIENVTGETQIAIFGSAPHPPELLLEGVAQEPPQIMLLRDQQVLQQLQPRMAEEIALIWPAPPGWKAGPVQIHFDKQAFKVKDNLYGQSSWLGFSPAARLTAQPETQPETQP